VIWLLEHIKSTVSGIDIKAEKFKSLWDVLRRVLIMKQGQNETYNNFYCHTKSNFEQISLSGRTHFLYYTDFITVDTNAPTADEKSTAKECVMAILMLQSCDKNCFGHILTSIDQSIHMGKNEYLKNLADMYDLLVKISGVVTQQNICSDKPPADDTGRRYRGQGHRRRICVTIAQRGQVGMYSSNPVAKNDGHIFPGITCYNSINIGHYFPVTIDDFN